MLPKVSIYYENGAISTSSPNADGVMGLVGVGAPVANGLELGKAYALYSFTQLENELKVTAANNAALHKTVKEFYAEAGDGAELWLMAFPETMPMATILDVTKDNARLLIDAANGRLRGLMVCNAGYAIPSSANMPATIAAAQSLCEYAAVKKYAPMFALISFENFNGDAIALPDLTLQEYNRVAVLIGDSEVNSNSSAIGLLGGRVAKNGVQRNIGAVRDGAVNTLTAFIFDTPAEQYSNVELLHDKGYITFRTFVGRSGYYFSDDQQATKIGDDYRHLTNRRIADKAYRIAYDTLIDEILGEIPVNNDGTLLPAFAKSWQGKVENAIAINMTARGELSTDNSNPKDKGGVCYVDAEQNVLSTSTVVVQLRVNPFGYARYIDVYLGFNVKQV